jgi:hypothetical protein
MDTVFVRGRPSSSPEVDGSLWPIPAFMLRQWKVGSLPSMSISKAERRFKSGLVLSIYDMVYKTKGDRHENSRKNRSAGG